MLRVGLTGGIACGKTVVGEMFARRGAHVILADRIAHELMRPGEDVYHQLVARFGPAILDPDGTISRPKLAEAAFSPASAPTTTRVPHPSPSGEGANQQTTLNRVAELNSIVHPAVIKRQEDWMDEIGRRDPHAVAIVEAALIYEARVETHFDKIIVVACDSGHKAARFAGRTGIPLDSAADEVARRSAAQIPDSDKISRADFVIYNNGSLHDAESQVEQVWRELAELANR
jgi:dephospho-CoA kinase